eukprot:TRINITY_DN1187_c0_g1_i1.p1 TRINITY_DN1187_c0_g1~~TRINITY_DN1187_c0_g1_i1.p1  ORF type:complete len:245 (-),score=20.98 TRINITY_DN1187_c0_g1_i1:140-811(-)
MASWFASLHIASRAALTISVTLALLLAPTESSVKFCLKKSNGTSCKTCGATFSGIDVDVIGCVCINETCVVGCVVKDGQSCYGTQACNAGKYNSLCLCSGGLCKPQCQIPNEEGQGCGIPCSVGTCQKGVCVGYCEQKGAQGSECGCGDGGFKYACNNGTCGSFCDVRSNTAKDCGLGCQDYGCFCYNGTCTTFCSNPANAGKKCPFEPTGVCKNRKCNVTSV